MLAVVRNRLSALAAGGVVAIGLTVGSAAAQDLELSADRYGTAARAALDAFPEGADVAVLVSGASFADGLAAAPVAAFYGGPILLTAPSSVPAATEAVLAELGVADVLVVGGPAAVGYEVSNALELDYQVHRIAGADRYATAAQAAREAFPEGADVAVLVSGASFADGLAAAPVAAFYGGPILLTAPSSVPAATEAVLAELGVADVLVVGGPAAVGYEVSNALELDYQVHRIAGG